MCDVSSVSAAQQGALLTKISVSVAKKQLDAADAQGQALLAMLESAANLGRDVDRGQQVDFSA